MLEIPTNHQDSYLGTPKGHFEKMYTNHIKRHFVMATLGPGWQMMGSSGLWWSSVNEIRN